MLATHPLPNLTSKKKKKKKKPDSVFSLFTVGPSTPTLLHFSFLYGTYSGPVVIEAGGVPKNFLLKTE